MLNEAPSSRRNAPLEIVTSSLTPTTDTSTSFPTTANALGSLSINSYSPASAATPSDDNRSPGRRQRRRIGDDDYAPFTGLNSSASSVSLHQGFLSARRIGRPYLRPGSRTNASFDPDTVSIRERRSSSVDSLSSQSEDDLAGAVGQLSLNEDEQLRYHGKVSGLHLLGNQERMDRRNEGGIWFVRFRVVSH